MRLTDRSEAGSDPVAGIDADGDGAVIDQGHLHVRVITSSPKWEPGIQDGKPVKVSYTFPVIFKLNGDEPATAPSTITIRKATGAEGDPIIYLDGEKFSGKISDIDVSTVQSMEVLKDAAAIEKYGEEAKNGVILIQSKKK